MRDVGRLGLGSAQFGMIYGVSNQVGQTSRDEVRRILALAAKSGIAYLDTAPAYGSEAILGDAMPVDAPFRVITKISGGATAANVEKSIRESLAALKLPRIHGLLFHQPSDLLAPNAQRLFDKLYDLRADGLVERIGVSVYREEEIDRLFGRYPLDLVQVPFNLFDQRLQKSGALARLKKRGVEVHARSIFLQGALLMLPNELPPALKDARRPLNTFRNWCEANGTTPLRAALAFALSEPLIDAVLLGVNTVAHLEEILTAKLPTHKDWRAFAIDDERILDPSTWNAKKSA